MGTTFQKKATKLNMKSKMKNVLMCHVMHATIAGINTAVGNDQSNPVTLPVETVII
jgi:hypothetical protein